MARGGSREGAGRPAGSPNTHTSSFRVALRQYCEQLGVDPHHTMVEMLADPAIDATLKLNAAKELAQYMEPKLKSVEHSGAVDHHVEVIQVTLE